LTRALLAAGARHVIAIEKDRRAIGALAEVSEHYPGRLHVVEDDALALDVSSYIARLALDENASRPKPALPGAGESDATATSARSNRFGQTATRVIANLPYNIATPLLIAWLVVEPWPPWYDALVLMFQREVAERIVADPGSKSYGRLSILAQWRCEAKILFDIPSSAFVPRPKVTSSLVRLVPRSAPLPCDRAQLERVTAAAFGQRRKMLRQSLKSLGIDPMTLLAQAGLDPTARAEDIAVAGFVELASALSARERIAP
jgi:16S rRNA (adenine1518-N6/adenine1519-N6)-dimethyltransferase